MAKRVVATVKPQILERARRGVWWLDRCCGAALVLLSGSLLLGRRTGS